MRHARKITGRVTKAHLIADFQGKATFDPIVLAIRNLLNNVGITSTNHPPVITIDSWDVNHSQMGG